LPAAKFVSNANAFGHRTREAQMNTLTVGVSSLEETEERMRRAFQGEKQRAYIGFASLELLWKVLTPKRWEILRTMTGADPLAIRELARRLDRDVKSVHGDVQSLLKAGVLDRTDDGRIVFPYDQIHVDLVVRAA
jgi:predicted transcriptional regulator